MDVEPSTARLPEADTTRPPTAASAEADTAFGNDRAVETEPRLQETLGDASVPGAAAAPDTGDGGVTESVSYEPEGGESTSTSPVPTGTASFHADHEQASTAPKVHPQSADENPAAPEHLIVAATDESSGSLVEPDQTPTEESGPSYTAAVSRFTPDAHLESTAGEELGGAAPTDHVTEDERVGLEGRAAYPLNASWPTEASIAATTTGEGVDVSRETLVRSPAVPVSRETVIEYGGTPLADQLADETRRRLALDEAVLPLPQSTRIFTISNQKGGVGKTTTAVNLAAALARSGARVLVVDLDPQGNASTALGVDHRSEQQSVYEVLVADLPLTEVIRPSTEHERLDCVPATIHLAGAEIELVSLVAREQRLRRALDAHLASMERPYDYVFIDCPPSLGLLTINAFVAAREVLIPIQCEYYALEGLSQLLSNIELIEKHLNPELRLTTILLTMYDSRTNLAQQVAQEVRDHFPTQTLETIIPRSVRVSEAPSYGQSVISYDFGSTGSLSYREAAAEIARRSVANPKEHANGN